MTLPLKLSLLPLLDVSQILILGFSLLYPYGVLIREYLDPDRLGGKEIDGGRLLTPGISFFLVLAAGFLMVFGGRFSWKLSKP